MKKIILALLVVLLAAGSAYAVDVQVVKGAYYVRGAYWANHMDPANQNVITSANPKTEEDFTAYDHDMDLYIDFVVDETTKVITYFEIADEEPWNGYSSGGASGYDDNIEVKRVYLEHKFPTATLLYAGKMSGGTWGTAFQDNEGPAYRVKVVQMFPWGLIVGLVQKIAENGYGGGKDAEKDDFDAYAVGAVFKAGPVSIMPLWFHILPYNAVIDAQDDDVEVNYYTLDVTGNFGMIGFEAAYGYWDEAYDTARTGGTDGSTSSLYAKVWANFEAFKVGGLFVLGDYDSDAGFASPTGSDFDETYIMGEELEGGAGGGYQNAITGGSSGWNIYQLFADFAFGKFSLNGSITYYDSAVDAGSNYWRESSAMEYNIGAAYKITDNLTYDIGLGMCSIDLDENYGGSDPDDPVYAFHRIKVSF